MSTYVIGDIQGCYEPLVKLLDKVHFDPTEDKLWAVGDLVNRGPQSLETLRFLKSLGDAFFSVLGNHDLHFLALATGAYSGGKKRTLKALLKAPDCTELCEWLRYYPLLHHQTLETDSGPQAFLMMHAGLAPGWSLSQALSYAKEVESTLQGENYLTFLAAMYGDEPNIWHDKLDGMTRLRVITNYLTRLRFCNAEGRLELSTKTGLEQKPKGFLPWYKFQTLQNELTILFGHWAALEGVTDTHNIIALDTGCVWGRCLTMLRLEDKQRFSTDCD